MSVSAQQVVPSTQELNASQPASTGKPDVLDQLMKPEVQESLTVLVENLPKLAEMVTLLTKAYDLVQNLATDRVLIEDLKGGMEEFVKPIQEKAKDYASAAIEANDRAQADSATIGLFGLLRMLKDPQVQKTFRFAQAFLDVMAERQRRN
ncbi:DUF1641 domain-containing protein [Paenibacillus sp. P26]|nr:DUF1641 domain-containing protein [Paenibacillus sp. P26]UUZ91621.1 DUF1641 domain-containing protein [Paenibacillus sp. P25]